MPFVGNAVIAAAGMGTRLGAGIPKCLVEVNNQKIIQYQLNLLREVENVFIVVGFCEEQVMDCVTKFRSDAIFVRNSNFQHTTTLESFYLAAKIITGSCILLDGDMIVSPRDFQIFLNRCGQNDFLIGVSGRISEDPVYAHISQDRQGKVEIQKFSAQQASAYEWANIVYLPANFIKSEPTHLYQYIQRHLPMPCMVLDRFEIDTAADLSDAERQLAQDVFSWNVEKS